MERQVIIKGSPKEPQKSFLIIILIQEGSKLGAIVSNQSEVVPSWISGRKFKTVRSRL
jgi:pyridoxine/pyridoxamine 5'-phosphate oxidase